MLGKSFDGAGLVAQVKPEEPTLLGVAEKSVSPSSPTTPTPAMKIEAAATPTIHQSDDELFKVPDAYYTKDQALDDLLPTRRALDLFLQSKMVESEECMERRDPDHERLYIASGLGLIQAIKSLMSFEDEDLADAIENIRRASALAQQHRKPQASLPWKVASLIIGSDTIGFIKQMTPVELHAELVYAESLTEKAVVGIAYAGDWFHFIKEALNVRTATGLYRDLYAFLQTMDAEAEARGEGPEDKSIDNDFRSGVYLGMGLTHLVLSLLPSRVMSLAELFGYKGDRDTALKLLAKAGGWQLSEDHDLSQPIPGVPPSPAGISPLPSPSAERPNGLNGANGVNGTNGHTTNGTNGNGVLDNGVHGRATEQSTPPISAEDEGLRRPVCDVALLIFHLVLSTVTIKGVDLGFATRVLEWNMKRYPNGVFYLLSLGRLQLIRSQPRLSIATYKRSMTVQNQYPQLYHLAYWEMGVAHLALGEVSEALPCWEKLYKESTWSKAVYCYAVAACLVQLGRVDEAKELMAKVGGLTQRIAGKSIPVEKFVTRKARKFETQKSRLALPALELTYIFQGITRAPRDAIQSKLIPVLESLLRDLGNPSSISVSASLNNSSSLTSPLLTPATSTATSTTYSWPSSTPSTPGFSAPSTPGFSVPPTPSPSVPPTPGLQPMTPLGALMSTTTAASSSVSLGKPKSKADRAAEKAAEKAARAAGKQKAKADKEKIKGEKERVEGYGPGYWDDLCLAHFLLGVCLRYMAYPDPDAIVDPSNVPSTLVRDLEAKLALEHLQAVIKYGPKIELDHHLVYHAHYEVGRLRACMGDKAEAKRELDLVLSGKTLEINAAGKKGKYSMENALVMRSHAALEGLEHGRPL